MSYHQPPMRNLMDPAQRRLLELRIERDRHAIGTPQRERINRQIAMLTEAGRPKQPTPEPIRKAL